MIAPVATNPAQIGIDPQQLQNAANSDVSGRVGFGKTPSMADAPDHTKVEGRFNQYTSGFWALALPALSARYVLRFFDGLFTKAESSKPSRRYAALAGAWMLGNTGFYAERTYADMKRMLSETVAYETGKNPNDVGINDFRHSDNEIVQRTMHNFIKRTAMRAAVGLTFFTSFIIPERFRTPKADAVDLGVGMTGAYLYSDVIGRKATFFEALQSFIDRKINHSDAVGEVITDNDLMNLYATHMRDGAKAKGDPVLAQNMDTLAWKQDQVIFGRMAELMNETYKNAPNTENANFNVPKLLYLLGHNLIQRKQTDQSLAYIEIANKYGIPAVQQVKNAVDKGMAFGDAVNQFPVSDKQIVANSDVRGRVGFGQDRPSLHVERLSRQEQTAQSETRTV